MDLSEDKIRELLATVPFPGFRRDIVSAGAVRQIRIDGNQLQVEIDPGSGSPTAGREIVVAVERALQHAGIAGATVRLAAAAAGSPALPMAGKRPSVAAAGGLDRRLVPDVSAVIAVASGKGGVGKSTVAVNLAVALARQGLRVGLMDADIYGPSVPMMMGIDAEPETTAERKLIPFERFGVRLMSLGFLIRGRDSAVIWRGPMVMKAIEQLLGEVLWGELDLLVVDMPPGTGDAQLTLSQKIQLAGAVIVTTPQDVALADAIKGVAMFRKVGVNVMGIIENMSFFQCPHCSGRTEIFGSGGGKREAQRLGVPLLGEIPLDVEIRRCGDGGTPVVAESPDSPQARAFLDIATRIRAMLEIDPQPAEGSHDGIFKRFRRVWQGHEG